MTTATLLNGHLVIEGFIIALILCRPAPIFKLTTLLSKHLLQLTRRKNIRNKAILNCLLTHAILGREIHRYTVFTEWSLIYTEGYFIALILCIPVPIFHLTA